MWFWQKHIIGYDNDASCQRRKNQKKKYDFPTDMAYFVLVHTHFIKLIEYFTPYGIVDVHIYCHNR